MKILPVGATLFHEDGRKDKQETNNRFLQIFEGVYKLVS